MEDLDKNQLISIIIINYNGKKWIKKCFDSLKNQTFKNFEVIVVDNNSSDNSIEQIKNYYSFVKIIQSKKNLGFAGGNNLGIKNANGQLILLLNYDTWFKNDFIERLYKEFISNNVDIVSPSQANYFNQKKSNFRAKIDPLGHCIHVRNNLQKSQSFYLSGTCLLFPRELYEETLGLDSDFFMYFEEIDWFWRLNLLNKSFKQLDDIYIYHYSALNKPQKVSYLKFLWRNQNCLQMLLKNYSFLLLILVIPIYLIINIFEIIFFLLILKPRIAFSYIEGWIFNIKNIKKTLEKRKWVQKNRKINDIEVIKKMKLSSAKISHLIRYINLKFIK